MIKSQTKNSEKWISEIAKKILILSESGTSISGVVNSLQKKYKSKQTCWAAVSRACKKLADKGYLSLKLKNNRISMVQTTITGKRLIRKICGDIEILSLSPYLPKIRETSIKIKKKFNFSISLENLHNNFEIQKLILEILAKYGELSLDDILFCIEIPKSTLRIIIDHMIKTSLILRVSGIDNKNEERFQINWKYLFLPIRNIENESETKT